MERQLKEIARKVVRVVAPPLPPVEPARLPKNEPPALGHRPGVDKNDYGLTPDQARAFEPGYTTHVNGRAYRIFFLCGHPRSGTHWMDHVLNRHKHVLIDGEYRFEALRKAVDDITGNFWHAGFKEPMKSEAENCFRDSVRRIVGASSARKPDAQWLGDRTPRCLQPFLPGAPHLLIIRDPRDVLVSWAHQEIKNEGFHYVSGEYEPALGEYRKAFLKDPAFFKNNPDKLLCHERWVKQLAGRWRFHMRSDLETIRRVDAGEVPMRVHVVRYERVHSDPEGERERMYSFLGVHPRDAEPLSEETRSKPGHGREDPHSIYRKGAVGDWERYFSSDARTWFKEMASDTLIELGYAPDPNW